ncbi:MAG: thioredoxin family protein, partial [Actinobacteria bacterium]|nr:thioredoxin family protein [Actinomycetota bacterium]
EVAVERGFCGSPTVLIDGVDPFSNRKAMVGLACRLYLTQNGPAGSPTIEQLRTAITAAHRRH